MLVFFTSECLLLLPLTLPPCPRSVKRGEKVCIVGLEQSFGHFHSVGLKLGLSLLKLRDQGTVRFYDGLKKVLELSNSESGGPLAPTKSSNSDSLVALYKEVVDIMQDTKLLVVDNVSILSCLGHSPQVEAGVEGGAGSETRAKVGDR